MNMEINRLATRSIVTICGLALSIAAPAAAQPDGTGPDVTVFRLDNTLNYGELGGVRAYSVGTTSCNRGTEPLWWCDDEGAGECDENGDDIPDADNTEHPVIAQGIFRLHEGKFEQLGMSWLKHGFLSTNTFEAGCGSCVQPPAGGDQLGVGCTDTYGAGLNGSRPLGLRSEVNPTDGTFPFPYTVVASPQPIDQRIRVEQSEIDPAQNPGARYWVEGHYVTADDHQAGNAFNNASYREVAVNAATFNLSFVGGTVEAQAGIFAWQAADPTVEIVPITLSGRERINVARSVTWTGSAYRYVYAVHNMTSRRAVQAFEVDYPVAAAISNAGFRDVDNHSGEIWDNTDWTIGVDGGAGRITWSTEDFATNQLANAIRWSTTYTFWFDSDLPPTPDIQHLVTFFTPGLPSSMTVPFVGQGTILFADGFETGDLSAWSLSVP